MIKSTRLITAALLAFFPLILLSQTFTIGAFTGQNDSTTYPTPFGDNRESTRAQYLYLSSELTAAGATAGNITKVGFNVVDVTGVGAHENWTLKLLLTSSITLTNGTWQSGATTLYGPVNYTPTVGLNEFALSAPFYWSGAANANLVVEICHTADPANPGNFSSNNAVVQLTTGLAFNGSRTRAKNNDEAICSTEETGQQGMQTRRPVLSLTFCYPPTDLTLNGVTSTAAAVSWTPPNGNAPSGYDYTYGLVGYQPGVSGMELGNGSTTLTSATLTGLNGLETYAFWVRSDCGDGYSRWAGPLDFTTEPSCGDLFMDSGGPASPYGANENYVKTFCPDIPDNALTMSFFSPISIGPGDTLKIYNGDDSNAPLLAALSGVYSFPSLPGPFTCTTASGCLTAHFTSDDVISIQDLGWIAPLSCAPLPINVCYEVLELEAENITSTSADVSWLDMFGAATYWWELVELPYQGPASFVQSDVAYLGTNVSFTNLESGTTYQFAVRTNCINGANSAWDTITFVTPVNCNGDLIQCNQIQTFSASKTGIWNITECGIPTPGKERVFRFVAPQTKSYKFEVTAASGGYVSYFIKSEAEGCNSDDWECIDDFNVPGASSLPAAPGNTLTAGTLYYILADPQTTSTVSQSFKISECNAPNDIPTNAIEIQVNTPCEDNIYSNIGATLDLNEPDPDVDDSDGLKGRWLDAADETVWFKLQAPPSGTITILTNPNGIYYPNEDTQLALYAVGDESDYSTFVLLVSDEDNGGANLGYNSVVSYTGLIDGEYYYIQVDGYGATGEGAFCIAVIETVERLDAANCDTDYTIINVNENKWYNIWATPDDLDIGPLVAAINPHGLNLDSVICRVQKNDEVPTSNDDFPYLPFYYYFESTEPFVGSVSLRLFFNDSEFAALKDSANTPNATLDDLETTRFNGNVADCNLLNNSGQFKLLDDVSAVPLVGTFYLEITTDSLGEFGGRLNPPLLPLTLQSFGGKVQDQFNLLEWTTLLEKNVAWHIVERAADGKNWKEMGRLPGQANSTAPLRYELEDLQPLAKAYYRLRSVDFDGTASISHAILLTRKSEVFGITNVFPSPATDRLTVQFSAVNEEDVAIRVTDFIGRVVLEQSFVAEKGVNEEQLSLRQLPAGIYSVTVANGESVSAPVRIVKQ